MFDAHYIYDNNILKYNIYIYVHTYVQIFTNLFKLEMKLIENIKNKQARRQLKLSKHHII